MFPETIKNASPGGQGHRRNSLVGFFDFIGRDHSRLLPHISITYYSNAAPVATSIDLISQEFSSITPKVRDKRTGDFVENHPVLDLLAMPNSDSTYKEFATRLSAFLLITGESYIIGTGPVRRPPLEIFIPTPVDIELIAGSRDGFLQRILFNRDVVSQQYEREEINKQFRFFARDRSSEAWQVKTFNPRFSSSNLGGQSPLKSIMPEIEQYIEACVHNLSILKRGARPSGIFSTPEELSQDQFDRLSEQIDNWFSGGSNAGRPILGENSVTYTDAMITARDMDFLNLKKNNTEAIYNHLHIPLPLVSPDTMTLANFETAKLSLYDNAVLPLADRLFEELTNYLMPKYPRSENLEIFYDSTDIPALEIRRTEAVKLRKDVGVNTVNELRQGLGMEGEPDGDVILVPSNLQTLERIIEGTIPAENPEITEVTEEGEAVTEEGEEELEEEMELSAIDQFVDILKNTKDKNGKRVYTDKDILHMVDVYGL